MDETPIDMNFVVEKESSAKSPILLCSAPGFDASFKVENLAKEQNKKLASVAIGSAEGFEQADKAINQGCKSGQWVLLKNVHLAPQWLSQLEKKIYGLSNINESFRLFLAMEFNPKVPSTLIRQSYKLVFEPPDGIKASLQRTYKTVLNSQRTDRAPVERSKLHFLLAWLHSVILERLRYTPIGWTKTYEFNEADQRCSLDLIDEFVDNIGERTNIPPEKLPWDALKTILCQNLYGGKVFF
jgi:dynein heavy chain 1